jgi:uncharacterized membrane protein HdeD (DUF308 family)
MERSGAQSALVASALVVAGIHGYRVVQGDKGLKPLGEWLTGFGATFFILALLVEVSPAVGGYAALLVATADFLDNGVALMRDVTSVEGGVQDAAGVTSNKPLKAVG